MAGPFFSVIIPTRNRPDLLALSLKSLLTQSYNNFEIIVVDDCSLREYDQKYSQVAHTTVRPTRLLRLEPAYHQGHGPSYARNYGAAHARGDYLCFLDDDDQWTDPLHLQRVAGVLVAKKEPISLILANQQAYRNGTPIDAAVWIEDLEKALNREPDADGAYIVTARELLGCSAHCHLNTIIVSLNFYSRIGGFDESLRYEEDRDFYLRAIDEAEPIKFLPFIVSRHNVAEPKGNDNISTSDSEILKRLSQLRVFDKAILFSKRGEIRRYAMRQRAYSLQHIANEAARIENVDTAGYYLRQALAARPGPRWLANVIYRACAALNAFMAPPNVK